MTRGSSSKERNFLLFRAMREKTGKIFTRQGKRSFPFTRHTSEANHGVQTGIWDGLAAASVCVCVHRITKDNFAALFVFTEICASDDTFMLKWKCEGRGEGKRSGKSVFRNGWKENRKTLTRLLLRPAKLCFLFITSLFLKSHFGGDC